MSLNWVEVDAAAIRGNLAVFRQRLSPGVRLGAVVKSNAYGHGILEVAAIAAQSGADWLCVNSLEEAVRLREACHDLPLLVMGYIPLADLETVVLLDLRPVVYRREVLETLAGHARRHGRTVAVHLKVETGTHRQGVAEADVPALADYIRAAPGLRLEGLSTHFANIEDTTEHGYANTQIECFDRIAAGLREAGHELPVRHAACSAATLLFRRVQLDLVRVGISMYGLWPSKETYLSCLERAGSAPQLRPALTWKTRVAQVKPVPEGAYVGYGCSYRTSRASRIAVLPVGYHEGYDRGLSGVAHVLIGGRRAPVRGRICMNMCLVDVTDSPGVAPEDEVVLLGSQGTERIAAEQLAAWCGTIAYEVVSRIHPGIPRVVVEPTET